MKPALLVIDVQQALCTGEYAAHDIGAVIDRINALTAKARSAGTPVIFVQHEEAGEGELAFDTDGWQLAEGLAIEPSDRKLRKTACDSFHRTELESMLKQLGVTDLIVTGLQSEYCVDSTVRGALAHGYPVTLVADAHSTMDNGVLPAAQIIAHHNRTLAGMQSFGPRVTVKEAALLG
ncbi:cysteine hydrolase family protein [soil metagenome]